MADLDTVSAGRLSVDGKFKRRLAALKRKVPSLPAWGPRSLGIEIKCNLDNSGDYEYSWCFIAITLSDSLPSL